MEKNVQQTYTNPSHAIPHHSTATNLPEHSVQSHVRQDSMGAEWGDRPWDEIGECVIAKMEDNSKLEKVNQLLDELAEVVESSHLQSIKQRALTPPYDAAIQGLMC